jgi:hypothetical protein
LDRRDGEQLWEIAVEPIRKRKVHSAVEALSQLVGEYTPLTHLVYRGETGQLARCPKDQIVWPAVPPLVQEEADEEENNSVSITAELELLSPFRATLLQ